MCLTLAVVWLVLASFAGLISSIKLHAPDWWVQYDWLTFGRIRAMHTSMVAYGWCSLAGIGVAIACRCADLASSWFMMALQAD